MRSSSPALTAAFADGAASQGADVRDVGLASTDLAYYAAGSLGPPAAVVTAGHNAATYDGSKLCRAGATPVGQHTGLADIGRLIEHDMEHGMEHGMPGPVHGNTLRSFASSYSVARVRSSVWVVMTIVVRRDTGGFAALVRFRVRLDGVVVGRVGRGKALRLTLSGGPQRLSVSIDWVRSNELTVTDPGPDTNLEVFLTDHGGMESVLRSYVAPDSVLVLVPAGEPVPAPPPVRPEWCRLVRTWLVMFLLLVVGFTAVHAVEGDVDPGGVAGLALSVSLGCALVIGAATLLLNLRHR